MKSTSSLPGQRYYHHGRTCHKSSSKQHYKILVMSMKQVVLQEILTFNSGCGGEENRFSIHPTYRGEENNSVNKPIVLLKVRGR